MILDSRTEFADAVSVGTPNNTTVNVGDIINSEVARDMGNGQPLFLVVQVTTAITGTTSIVNFQLVSDSTSTIATDDTQTIHFRTDDIPEADLLLGVEWVHPLPVGNEGINDYEQFLAFQVRETSGNVLTAGAVNAFLTLDPKGWVSYPDGSN